MRQRGERTEEEETARTTVVAIGASAGGLAALQSLFAEVPDDSGIAFVVVVHLDPGQPSHLPELLQTVSRLPVQHVTATVRLEANRIYVIPPNANLEAIDSHLRLSELEERRRERAPIDHFFRTLARTHDGNGIGVILTGTGSDGALGIQEIRNSGGFTIVQDPREAEYDGMPRSALATGAVDLVLPLARIPKTLVEVARTRPRLEEEAADTRDAIQRVLALVRARTARDFTWHKRSTVVRRIKRRMQVQRCLEVADYLELLRRQPEEVAKLADEFLITVTSFFRDPEVFRHLEEHVLPRIFAQKRPDEYVRVWSVGCATGEEAYSLAILLLEAAERCGVPPHRIQLFASDLHEPSLKKARQGLYAQGIEEDVGAERLMRYFQRQEAGYRVLKALREMVVFAPHDLLADPPFSKLDLISCRNLLIYLQRGVQRDVMELFHYALRPDGCLLLGTSESVGHGDIFLHADKSLALYRKRNVPRSEPRLPVFPVMRSSRAGRLQQDARSAPVVYGALHQRMVERYAPPSILVAPDDRVVHLSEHVGRYLVHPGGEMTSCVFQLVRQELRAPLRVALGAARASGKARSSGPVALELAGQTHHVTLDVRPTHDRQLEEFVLVIFEEHELGAPAAERRAETGVPSASAHESARIPELEVELDLARRRLQVVVEEYETNQEEMRVANEELQSMNEELRSTLEELETSKEELQSTNEELHAVNQENRNKVEELARLSSDLQNLLTATDIATLFLDRELRIMRFTPRMKELFNLRAPDRGRPLSDLTHHLDYDGLLRDAELVLERLAPIEREVRDGSGHWYLARILPYRSTEDRIEGLVITFLDVTPLKLAQEDLLAAKTFAESTIQGLRDPLLVLGPDLRVQSSNPAFYELFGTRPEETVGRLVYELGNGQWNIPQLRVLLEEVLPQDNVLDDYEVAHAFEGIGERVMVLNGGRLATADQILLVIRDVTEEKRAENALREKTAVLEAEDERKQYFLATLGHELRNPLAAIESAIQLLALGQGEAHELLPVLTAHTNQLTALVNDLLEISRVTRGKIRLRKRPIDLARIVRDAVEGVRDSLDLKQQDLALSAPGHLDMHGDPTRLKQVVSNLLSNASKFTPAGGRIEATLIRADHEVVLTLRDEGCGLEADRLEGIFEPFVQEDPGLGGLGIGLAMVKGLVELHGGTVRAQSAGPEHGCTFTVRVPLGEVGPADVFRAPELFHRQLPSSARVLVVDDAPDNADLLALLLRTSGAETRVAYTGAGALQEATSWKPHVALVDIGLPDISGYEVAQRIRALPEGGDVLLLAVTGFGDKGAEDRAREAGFQDRLIKPVDHERLYELMVRHLVPMAD